MDFLGGLIGTVGKLVGGIFNSNSQEKTNQANINAQAAINAQNIAEQEKFAQNTIQWKVQDANKAGINPLAALGANTSSFSNIVAPTSQSSTALGDAMGDAGQSLGRAIAAQAPAAKRAAELEEQLAIAKIANVNSDTAKNQAEASRMATRLGAPGLPPPFPPMPPPDQRKLTGETYDRHFATPTTQYFVTPSNDLIAGPSDKFSTATQTLAAAPTSAIGAADLLKSNMDLASKFYFSGHRGDAYRASIPLEQRFYTPF